MPGVRSVWLWAVAIYLSVGLAFVAFTPGQRLRQHTPYNHYALQAEAWLQGRLDLGGPPPAYTGNNDFALYQDKHYVSFPPVPALLLLPAVALAGSAEAVRDGLWFAAIAPLGPALLFLALERLEASGRGRGRKLNACLALLLGLGTVYWFSAVQGTVWFAGHVVTMALSCGYLWCSLGASAPAAAGLCLALAIGTRPTLACAAPLFLYEAFRASQVDGALDRRALWRRLAAFALPAAFVLALLGWHNAARFGDPTEFGHHYLTVVWRERIDRWGLFSLHYLPTNLTVFFGGVPFSGPRGWQINVHGLALWLTSPFFAWALWPERPLDARRGIYLAAALCAVMIAIPNLLYQNTGWMQFGYRFSNDFAPFVVLMIAAGRRALSAPFWALASFSVAVNAFGALSFGNPAYAQRYFIDRTQKILVHPD